MWRRQILITDTWIKVKKNLPCSIDKFQVHFDEKHGYHNHTISHVIIYPFNVLNLNRNYGLWFGYCWTKKNKKNSRPQCNLWHKTELFFDRNTKLKVEKETVFVLVAFSLFTSLAWLWPDYYNQILWKTIDWFPATELQEFLESRTSSVHWFESLS